MNDFPPDTSPADREALARTAAWLHASRPAPAREFRGDLGRAVELEERRRHVRPRPPGLWQMVAGLAAAGSLLLALAASQI